MPQAVTLDGSVDLRALQEKALITKMWDEADREKLVEEFAEATAEKFDEIGGHLVHKTQIHRADDGVAMNIIIGKDTQRPFDSAVEAIDFYSKKLILGDDDVAVLYRQLDDGSLAAKVVGKPTDDGSKFFIGIHTKQGLDATHNLSEGALANGGILARLFGDRSTILTRKLADASANVTNRESMVEKELKKLLKPVSGLNSKKQTLLFAISDRLEKAEVELTARGALTAFDHDKDLARAYINLRKFWDINYEHSNQLYRNVLKDQGYKMFTNEEGMRAIVRPLAKDEILDVGDVVYDSRSHTLKQATVDDIDNTYVAKTALEADGQFTQYIRLYDAPEALPARVLNKKLGYLGRSYDARYKIVKPYTMVINGTPEKRWATVAMADDVVDAEKHARSLSPDHKVQRLREYEDRINSADEIETDWDTISSTGRIGLPRGEEIKNVSGKRTLASLGETLEQSRARIARSIGTSRWSDYMIDTFMRKYAGPLNLKSYPFDRKISDAGLDLHLRELRSEAELFKDQIQTVLGMRSSYLSAAFDNWSLNLAESMYGSWLGNMSAKAITKLADVNIPRELRKIAFIKFMIGSPIRQFLMQPSQTSMYFSIKHGSSYLASGRAAADNLFLIASRTSDMLAPGTMDKILGALEKESVDGVEKSLTRSYYKHLLDDLNESGMLESVESHQFLSMLQTNKRISIDDLDKTITDKLVGAKSKSVNAVRAGMHFMKMAGMGNGERLNQLNAWLVSRNKWMKENYGGITAEALSAASTRQGRQEIVAYARQISGNMDIHGRSRYQRGILGVPFQFMAHTVKMTQLMMPDTKFTQGLVNTAISKADRRRIAAGQAILFGSAGFGINDVIDTVIQKAEEASGITLEDDTKRSLQQGMLGMGFNYMLQAVDDPEGRASNINISGVMGPLSGLFAGVRPGEDRPTTPWNKVLSALNKGFRGQNVDFMDLILGPSGSILRTTFLDGNGNSILSRMGQIHGMDSIGPSEVVKQVDNILSWIGQYDYATQARLAQRVGYHLDRSGNRVTDAARGEMVARMLFGLRSNPELDVQDEYAKLNGRMVLAKEPSGNEVKRAARTAAKIFKTQFLRWEEGEIGDHEFYESANMNLALFREAYNDDARVYGAFASEYWDTLEKDELKEDKMFDQIINRLEKGTASYGGSSHQFLKENNSLSKEKRDTFLQIIEESFKPVEVTD
jgi:hypothetical protein